MGRVAVVGGVRTPFVKAATAFTEAGVLDLSTHVTTSFFERSGVNPLSIDELVWSSVLLNPRYPNLAREIILRTGLPKTLVAHFASNNCISGLVAATNIYHAISGGRIRSGLAGGVESMSNPALTVRPDAEAIFLKAARVKGWRDRVKVLSRLRPKMLPPETPSPKEPSTGLTMGDHCEITAQEFGIARNAQDELALRSHQNAGRAQAAGVFSEQIVPFKNVTSDLLVRPDTTLEKLASLKAVFDRSAKGTITAGNASALTDGASIICLMEESFCKLQGLTPLAFVEGIEFAAVPPSDGLLMAPALAVPRLLQRLQIRIGDIDMFEIHEAFAAQVLTNLAAWEKGWNKYPDVAPIGAIPIDKMNIHGGSLALGHPFAATGGRIMLNAAHELKRRGQGRALISICAAGGMACAMTLTA